LEHLVSEHEASPNVALYLSYVIDVGVLLREAFERTFLVCKRFHSPYIAKSFLSYCHHFRLCRLVSLIVRFVEGHEYSVAENTGRNKQ
jgi:hypothetical protein